MEQTATSFKGYSLFEDIDDHELKARNRGTILANIVEEHAQAGKVSKIGLHLILGYFKAIPDLEKAQSYAAFQTILNERGISSGS